MTYGNYGSSCIRCGGTPDGNSHNGYVGKCSCGLNPSARPAPAVPVKAEVQS